MPRPTLEFWYEFASTYSYLSAMRIDDAAGRAGVAVVWRPFLLGPILGAQGLSDSPFNLYPVKGRYMWRDMEREAAALRLPFCRPKPFPQNSLLAARVALVGLDRGWTPDFSRAVFAAEFGKGRSIGDPATLAEILASLGENPDAVLAEAGTEANKARLRRAGEEALSRGVFGAPTFFAEDGEMFWGNDRLEQALAWAVERARCSQWPV
ncbi:2-hydroxychromene-2-carboxylate isomerase [Microvirga thermotolerans]|uniref:2-hydroxychromene-2-carboxylate isomerase n=1 Tax=Microvirga thermotolerans TaxID=2651334 RepID=A0A5P9K1L2_9HYPH|nr:2-hydroxychromene-2-carboxylate isomerase [Microvirga thermotolerans]QFU17948.1 2-hydroxychromene-2-carboxylate isomerase [Microvirga thermotolerans]